MGAERTKREKKAGGAEEKPHGGTTYVGATTVTNPVESAAPAPFAFVVAACGTIAFFGNSVLDVNLVFVGGTSARSGRRRRCAATHTGCTNGVSRSPSTSNSTGKRNPEKNKKNKRKNKTVFIFEKKKKRPSDAQYASWSKAAASECPTARAGGT